MTKRDALEILSETIWRYRIQRDAGDPMAHDQVVRLTGLLMQLRKMKKPEVDKFVANYGLDG